MSKDVSVLIIMDGWGEAPPGEDNAVSIADTPNVDRLKERYPTTTITPFGIDVGLPQGQMGNSEVGHLNLGAGRIVYQPLTRVSKAIADGELFTNEALVGAMENAKSKNTALHLMGLVSDGGVHSHNSHLYALLEMAKKYGLTEVYVHCYMDGRDVPPQSGKDYIIELEEKIKEIGVGRIATVAGRFYAMDRDNIWDRVKRAYDALVMGLGVTAPDAVTAMEQSYQKNETDEFVQPTVVLAGGKPTATIREDDSVIFFNFRPDRARQLARCFIDPKFTGFERAKGYFPVYFVSMTTYDATFKNIHVAFGPLCYDNTLGEYLSKKGLRQLRIAETQKYAHVTYFFNGGVEKPNEGEDRVLIESPKLASFADKPEMSAYGVTDEVVRRIESGVYDVIIMNYANCDMVGHTGEMDAAVKAVEAVDTCVGRVVEAVTKMGGRLIITADHGNAEKMWDELNNEPYTAHTSDRPVPLIVVDDRLTGTALRNAGRLADVAPTLLDMMGLEKPEEMTGESLIVRK